MVDALMKAAALVEDRFRAIPREVRDEHQGFAIRVWRGLSWLKRAARFQEADGKFISLWIAFNAVYGYLEDGGRDAKDHASWQSFLARIVALDAEDRVGRVLRDSREDVTALVACRYLFRPFWLGQEDWEAKLAKAVRRVADDYRYGNTLDILQELFERLYVLRTQVFHGAATSGSKLNRENIECSVRMLGCLVPAMLKIVLDAGVGQDCGEVCFPPIREDEE